MQHKLKHSMSVKEHEEKTKDLSQTNKNLGDRLELESSESKKRARIMDQELDDLKQMLGKKEMVLTQIDCENKVFKKMVRKYENLVNGLREQVGIHDIDRNHDCNH